MNAMANTMWYALTVSFGMAQADTLGLTSEPCESDCVEACCLDLEEFIGGFQEPELWIGSVAPTLDLSHDIRTGAAIDLDPGKIRVVEFWATWCGPCIAQFPHLSELQQRYPDSVQVVSVNIWDNREGESFEARSRRVDAFVEDQGDRMQYAVAMEKTDRGVSTPWMDRAGLNGIPASFIVDIEGRIAWIGHPIKLDRPLVGLLTGSLDAETLEKEARELAIAKRAKLDFWNGVHDPEADPTRIFTLGRAIARQEVWDDALGLNGLAWPLLMSDTAAHQNDELALELTTRAAELAAGDEAYVIYDTHAVALYRAGQIKRAIEYQRRALENVHNHEAADMMRRQMERRLKEMEAAAG